MLGGGVGGVVRWSCRGEVGEVHGYSVVRLQGGRVAVCSEGVVGGIIGGVTISCKPTSVLPYNTHYWILCNRVAIFLPSLALQVDP